MTLDYGKIALVYRETQKMALTLWTTPVFDEHLDKLKKSLNQCLGTGSGVIKFVVENYDNVDLSLQEI